MERQVWREFKDDGLVVLGVSIMDSPERLKDFAEKYELTYPQWRDPGAQALGKLTVQGVIPRTVVLDREHRVVLRKLGYTEEKFKGVVAAARAAVDGTPYTAPVELAQVSGGDAKLDLTYKTTRVETLASEGNVGFFTSVALDAAGRPAVACKDYTRGALLVSRWTGSQWQHDVVDNDNAGWTPSIAYDPTGGLGVSYGCGMGEFDMRFARFNGKGWAIEICDKEGNPFKATSLAFGPGGDPLISYFAKDNQDLRLAKWIDAEWRWSVETVDAEGDVGTYSSLALDKNGSPMISYYDEGLQVLKFARWNGGQWVTEVVDSQGQVGLHCSLGLDPAGRAVITYFDLTNEDLKIARWSETGWEVDVVDQQGTVGQRCSLQFDSKGRPAISYFGNGTLKFAWWNGAEWEILTVDDSGLTGNYTSLALDPNDNARISYFDVSNADLKFAWVDRAAE